MSVMTAKQEYHRVAVVCYIPSSPDDVRIFITLLYGSWRYITDHKNDFSKIHRLINRVNLIVFTHRDNIAVLKTLCKKYNAKVDQKDHDEHCWYVRQDYDINIGYGPINSFVMFNRSDIYDILLPYKYTLRTDYDVFLTPALYVWKVKNNFVVGKGGYSVLFTQKRLKRISLKLNMKHRGVHDVGSTWFGDSKLLINLSKKTIEITAHIYLNEFSPSLPGLRKLNLKKNKMGVWPNWWRPVSSLYGAEITLNHLIKDFSVSYKDHLDASSCDDSSIWDSPHVHCWHDTCEFFKFRFMRRLNKIVRSDEYIPSYIFHLFVDSIYDKDVTNMSIREYSTFIAWNSVGKYLKKSLISDISEKISYQ